MRLMRDAIQGIAERLENDEYRLGYGEEGAKIDFAIALTFARQERNMTQQQLADLLGVSQAYVARLESGNANPTLSKVGRIFAALWLRPIDRPFPLIEGYGPCEPPRNLAPKPDAVVEAPAPPAPDKPATKAAQAGN